MDIVDSGMINLLDKIRYENGKDKLIDFFIRLWEKDSKKAVDLINQDNLSFTALFLLYPKFKDLGIFEKLSIRNKIAVEFMDERILNKKQEDNLYSSKSVQKQYSVFKWILETGAPEDGISNELVELLDTAAAILIKDYRDRSVLPIISDLIFKRNKGGFFIHDLVWIFFESRDIKSLILIGNRLQSEEPKDVELACKLLCFVPGLSDNSNIKDDEKYAIFINWIEENNMFVHFTGESFQLTRRPMIYIVNHEAKYLYKMVSVDTGETMKTLNEKECELLDKFKSLDEYEKSLLSGFSLAMHRRSRALWQEWIQNPITEQLRIARSGRVYND